MLVSEKAKHKKSLFPKGKILLRNKAIKELKSEDDEENNKEIKIETFDDNSGYKFMSDSVMQYIMPMNN